VDLVGGAGVIAQQVRGARDVPDLADEEELAGVHRVQHRQLLDVLVDQVRELVQDPAPLLPINQVTKKMARNNGVKSCTQLGWVGPNPERRNGWVEFLLT